MSDFQGTGTFEGSIKAAVADLFVPSVLVLASHDLDNHFLARTGLTVAHFLQHHIYTRLQLTVNKQRTCAHTNRTHTWFHTHTFSTTGPQTGETKTTLDGDCGL